MNFLRKLSLFLRRKERDADMNEEMRQHLERRTQANLAAGMSADEACYAARGRGDARMLVGKLPRCFEATRTDFKRVVPSHEAASTAK